MKQHLQSALIAAERAWDGELEAGTRRLSGRVIGMRESPTTEAEARGAGGAGGAPDAKDWTSVRPSATAASLPTAPGDAGASGARENSAPISVRRIPLAQVA